MQKKYRSKDIFEEMEEKKRSPLIPIIIFVSVVAILSVISLLILNALAEYTNIQIPWEEESKEETKKNPTSSKDQMDLVVPRFNKDTNPTTNTTVYNKVLNAYIGISDIKADEYGYLITFCLQSTRELYTTIDVKLITLDDFYISTTFSFSDKLDIDENGNILPEQKFTTYDFRIKKTELDEIGMFGFNRIKLIYDIENNNLNALNQEYYLAVNNELNIVNERKGLIKIDQKNKVTVSYYKTTTASDATYIYFDFNNENIDDDIKVYVKKLTINNKEYDMSDFEETSERQSRKSIFLMIPTKDISRVNTMKVQFFLVEEDSTTKEKSFYITNEYSRAY